MGARWTRRGLRDATAAETEVLAALAALALGVGARRPALVGGDHAETAAGSERRADVAQTRDAGKLGEDVAV
jgi:hypothetical protein